jgi:hypothetical protein
VLLAIDRKSSHFYDFLSFLQAHSSQGHSVLEPLAHNPAIRFSKIALEFVLISETARDHARESCTCKPKCSDSAQRIDRGEHQPQNQSQFGRSSCPWADPLAEMLDSVLVPMLEKAAELESHTMLLHLKEIRPMVCFRFAGSALNRVTDRPTYCDSTEVTVPSYTTC